MFIGSGTVINVTTVLIGSTVGVNASHLLSDKVKSVVTDALGLITLLVGVLSALDVAKPELVSEVPTGTAILILLGSMLIGGITGSILGIEDRLERLGDRLKVRFASDNAHFTEGFFAASILFSVGPLATMGSISDGLGNGNSQLLLKSTLDLFASMAFAASFGWGVALSAVSVLVVQGGFTLFGMFLGNFISESQVIAMNATGGLLLLGIGLSLLEIKRVPVGDLLPALAFAPALTAALMFLHG